MGNLLEEVYDIIEQIRLEPSTKAKQEILKSVNNAQVREELLNVLKYAYNPRYVYSLKAFPVEATTSLFQPQVPFGVYEFLNSLKARKLTGNSAREAYIYVKKTVSPKESELLDWILDRDLHCGIAAKTINKVFPKLIPEMGYMRCSLPKQIKDWSKWDVDSLVEPNEDGFKINRDEYKHFVQEKLDGMFVNINVYDDRSVQLFTRAGTPIPLENPTMQNIVHDLTLKGTMEGYQIHGEMLVCDETGIPMPREISNGLLNSLIKLGTDKEITDLNAQVFIVVWDMIPIDHSVKRTQYPYIEIDSPYYYRFGTLVDFLDDCMFIHPCDTKRVENLEEAYEYALKVISEGGEGAVFKHCNGLWKNGTSKEQVKLKVEFVVDLEVVKFNEGTGKNKDLFGSIECKTSDGLLVVNVSSSGFTDKQKQEVTDNMDDYIGKVISVKANNIMYGNENRPHSLFLPVFVEFRDDKNIGDTYEEVRQQLMSTIKVNNSD